MTKNKTPVLMTIHTANLLVMLFPYQFYLASFDTLPCVLIPKNCLTGTSLQKTAKYDSKNELILEFYYIMIIFQNAKPNIS